jgi:short-subunit dehydrogenase
MRALVTGATGGIGQAIARALHRRGLSLLLSGRRRQELEALAGETGAASIITDLSDRRAVEALMERAGDVDVLVANAALPATYPLNESPLEDIDRALEVNLRAPIAMTRMLLPSMLARGSGRLIYISSISGKVASTYTSIYSATKFGLRGFALGLRSEVGDRGVGVSVVYPGFIREAGMFAETGVRLPFGVGTRSPEDVAHGVLHCIDHAPAECTVASLEQRALAGFAALAPELLDRLGKRLGAAKIAHELVEAQRPKRR